MADSINSLSPSLRDNLLLRNLSFADTITNNGLTGYASGIGLPASISHSPEAVQPSIDLLESNETFLNNNLLNNLYLPNAEQTRLVTIQNNNSIFGEQSRGGYLDKNGHIKGLSGTNTIDTISGVFSGAGSFDIRSSLAGRVLTSIGALEDTQLGIIGNRELLNAMKAKAMFNLRRETLGQINVNPLSLLMGNPLFTPDYSITVPSTDLGRVGDVALNILGFESPISYMDNASSIFNFELDNPALASDTFARNYNRIQNTGKGQVQAMFFNLQANTDPRFTGGGIRYSPGYFDERVKTGVDFNIYTTSDQVVDDGRRLLKTFARNIISDVPFSWNTTGNVDNTFNDEQSGDFINQTNTIDEPNVNTKKGGLGMLGENRTYEGNDWLFPDQGTLLGKTQALFDKGIIKTLLANKGMVVDGLSELETTETQAGGDLHMVSKGSAVKYLERSAGSSSTNPNDVFCRSWVNYRSYNQVGRLQKHTGLNPNAGLRSQNYKESVLDNNGFVRFGPYREQTEGGFKAAEIKRYMFSLENLAWANETDNLPSWELGPGDQITNTRGRIMWFPPYDLSFNESVSVGLDSNAFIGRGEPIYTYNNTERTGTLTFKILMDHPNYLNDVGFQQRYSQYFDDVVNSIFSGCGEVPETVAPFLTQAEKDAIAVATATKNPNIAIAEQIPPEGFKVFFPNDVTKLSGGNVGPDGKDSYEYYEVFGSEAEPVTTSWQKTQTGGYTPGITTQQKGTYEDRFNYGLNKGWRNETFLNELKRKLREECPACKIEISGYASTDGKTNSNSTLSIDRAKNIADFLRANVINDESEELKRKRFARGKENGSGKGETGVRDTTPVDSLSKKSARYVNVKFVADPEIDEINKREFQKKIQEAEKRELSNKIKSRFFNESEHFLKLKLEDPIVYNSIKDKIKFFHPTFHSITPEGFNSRLTFLHQCTRQGSTKNDVGRPDNMSFGMAPVCILRLGDFYHTKIMIESMNIDYENTWDLNPEGVGVQPMIATISLNFKFIGGHSMQGPINRLQNAVAFNFFANTEIFDPRADKIVINGDKKEASYVKGETLFGNVFASEPAPNDKPGPTTNNKVGETDQAVVATDNNSAQSTQTEAPAGEMKITGIREISLNDNHLAISERVVGFGIKLDVDNYDNTPSVLTTFLNKGLKVVFTSPDGVTNVAQEVINEGTDPNKRFSSSVTGNGYFMGQKHIVNGNEIYGFKGYTWVDGNYNISVFYNGTKIGSTSLHITAS